MPVVQIGRDFLQLERALAQQITRFLVRGALALEELEQAQRIARDGAILARAGAPFTLSDRQDIKDEMAKLASWDSELRRFMPHGVKSQEVFGLPRIVQTKPPKKGVH